jgi:hypothetical protein
MLTLNEVARLASAPYTTVLTQVKSGVAELQPDGITSHFLLYDSHRLPEIIKFLNPKQDHPRE